MPRFWRQVIHNLDIFVTVVYLALILAIPQEAFAWGREGHHIVVIVAEHYMRPETATHYAPRPVIRGGHLSCAQALKLPGRSGLATWLCMGDESCLRYPPIESGFEAS